MDTSEKRLREYIEKDIIYQDYKKSNKEPSDFERFCFVHCRDIENVLQENQQLKNDNAVMKAGLIQIRDEQLEQYKSVLDEIRECLEKDYSFAKRGDIPLMSRAEQLAAKLFEILDKVKK